MNFLFTHRSVVDIQRNVMKFRGKIITHYEHSTLQVTNLLANQFTLFLSRGFARAVVVVMKLEMASDKLWQRGFDECGKRRKLLE